MQPQTSKIITIFLLILIVLAAVYVYFTVRPSKDMVQQYQQPVLSVPADSLSKIDSSKLKGYNPNQPVPFDVGNNRRDNPFAPY